MNSIFSILKFATLWSSLLASPQQGGLVDLTASAVSNAVWHSQLKPNNNFRAAAVILQRRIFDLDKRSTQVHLLIVSNFNKRMTGNSLSKINGFVNHLACIKR